LRRLVHEGKTGLPPWIFSAQLAPEMACLKIISVEKFFKLVFRNLLHGRRDCFDENLISTQQGDSDAKQCYRSRIAHDLAAAN